MPSVAALRISVIGSAPSRQHNARIQNRHLEVANDLAAFNNNLVPTIGDTGCAGQPGWRLAVNSISDSGHQRGFAQFHFDSVLIAFTILSMDFNPNFAARGGGDLSMGRPSFGKKGGRG